VKKRHLDRQPEAYDSVSQSKDAFLRASLEGGAPNLGAPGDDRASTITTDKLKRFNDIYGYEHGPAIRVEQDEADQNEQLLVDEQND
jgi:hypothetical protein